MMMGDISRKTQGIGRLYIFQGVDYSSMCSGAEGVYFMISVLLQSLGRSDIESYQLYPASPAYRLVGRALTEN